MKIAVIGAGAIGALAAGYLKLKNQDVSLIGHPESVAAVKKGGLVISGVRGDFNISLQAHEKLFAKPDLAILATKTQDIEAAIKDNLAYIKGALILTTQNGVRADDLAARYIPKQNIISSIVMFGATYLGKNRIVHNFEGNWIIGKVFGANDEAVNRTGAILNEIFPTTVTENLKGMKYLKIFVNANNCIPAILGVNMQEAFSDINISRISIAIWKEGLEIINKTGIKLSSLPDFPLERLNKLTSLPAQEAAKIFSGIMNTLSKEPLYGSILQSIKRGRPSEIDYINGEFVRLAQENKLPAALNKKLVGMVHKVEESKKFFDKEGLLENTQGLYS